MIRPTSKYLPLLLLIACVSAPPPPAFDAAKLSQIDAAIETAIAAGKTPGGVFRLERDGAVYQRAYGKRSLVPSIETMSEDTIFDAASITKVAATTPAVFLL